MATVGGESVNPFEQNNYAYNENHPQVEMQPNPFADTSGVDTQPNVILFPNQQWDSNAVKPPGVDYRDGSVPVSNRTLEIPLSNQPGVTPSGTTAHELQATRRESQEAPEESGVAGKVFQYVQYYFDVDTDMVLHRMLNLINPLNPPDYLESRGWHFRHASQPATEVAAQNVNTHPSKVPHADIYGPFWTMTTLWVVIGIVVNALSRIAFSKKPDQDITWGYDFGIVVTGACVTGGFWVALPVLWWIAAKVNSKDLNFADLLCIHGYSLLYFLLMVLLCSIPFRVVHYVACIISGICASFYLVINLWKAFMEGMPATIGLALIALTVAFQLGLSAILIFFFFSVK